MYLAFALDHIPRRMRELGYGDKYITRYRHILAGKTETKTIEANNQFWFFIEPEGVVKIESIRGVYNMNDSAINVQQHEHSGIIKLTNDSDRDVYVLFIQVIPLTQKPLQNEF